MLEEIVGRLVSGALWGAGATAIFSLTRRGGENLRPVAKTLMKGYLVAADRLGEMTAEARESLNDLYAEAQAERERDEQAASAAAGDGATKRSQAPETAKAK